MSDRQHIKILSHGSKQTEDIAERIGSHLRGAEVIELVADLGGGKTTFVRGLARGIGSSNHISSPSFTISNEYHGKNLELIHFDFYRLVEAGAVENALVEFLGKPAVVIVIEWADIVGRVLPAERLSIDFSVKAEDLRELTLTYPSSLQYLVEGLV